MRVFLADADIARQMVAQILLHIDRPASRGIVFDHILTTHVSEHNYDKPAAVLRIIDSGYVLSKIGRTLDGDYWKKVLDFAKSVGGPLWEVVYEEYAKIYGGRNMPC